MVANLSASGVNRDLSSKFWWLSANHLKFTEELVMYLEKHVSGLKKKKKKKKCLHGFATVSESKTKSNGVETHFLVKVGLGFMAYQLFLII